MRLVFSPLLAVGLGGALGTCGRVGLSLAAFNLIPDHAYLATLLANIVGAGLIGYFAAQVFSPLRQAFLMTGFCGGFTTFSLFSLEVLTLAQERVSAALGYAGISLVLWMTAVWAGHRLARR